MQRMFYLYSEELPYLVFTIALLAHLRVRLTVISSQLMLGKWSPRALLETYSLQECECARNAQVWELRADQV